MKMGNIVSPWRYEAAAHRTLQSELPQPATIVHYDRYSTLLRRPAAAWRFVRSPLGAPKA
jgi:hypothetical protein